MAAFYPNTGQVWIAGITRTALANSVVSLYQSSITPSVLTTKAELEAAEADFGGYAPVVVANFNPAFLSVLGGAIQMPVVQFQCDGNAPSNVIGGAWLETAGGVLVSIIPFVAPKAMVLATDAIPLSEILRFGSGL